MSETSKDLLKTDAEMAQICQNAFIDIVAGTLASYSVSGRTYTKENISELQNLVKYYSRQSTIAQHGVRSVMDVRTSGSQP